MNIEGANLGHMTTPWSFTHMMRKVNAGERTSSSAISINDSSVAIESAGRGSGTNTPVKLGLESNVKISHFHQEVKGEIVRTAVKADAAANELLSKKMAEEGQPKV